jgi:hypothetical protein
MARTVHDIFGSDAPDELSDILDVVVSARGRRTGVRRMGARSMPPPHQGHPFDTKQADLWCARPSLLDVFAAYVGQYQIP